MTATLSPHLGRIRLEAPVYRTDANGFRVQVHAAGREISIEQAIALGLVDPAQIPESQIQAVLPRNVYDAADGRLIGRAGTVVSVADLRTFGIIAPEPTSEAEVGLAADVGSRPVDLSPEGLDAFESELSDPPRRDTAFVKALIDLARSLYVPTVISEVEPSSSGDGPVTPVETTKVDEPAEKPAKTRTAKVAAPRR